MSKPAGWQRGSFRGATFVTEGQEETGGRRGVLHEFPQAEKPVWEDLGRKAFAFTIDCHIRGADYPAGADRLRDALAAKGPGTLIHPWYGTMQVAVDSYSRSDSTAQGGFAAFSIDFLESGATAAPAAASDTPAQSRSIAAVEKTAAVGRFGARFTLGGLPGFVEQGAARVVGAASALVAARGIGLAGVGGPLSAARAALDVIGVRGAGLGGGIAALVDAVATAASSAQTAIPPLRGLLSFGADLPPVVGGTPARAAERANQAEIVQLMNVVAAANLAVAITDTDFASYQDAVGVRDAVADTLDGLALRQADRGDDAGAAAYDALRRAIVRDVTTRGGSLTRLQDYRPSISEPALVIAQRLYGDPATIILRAADIVARNRVRHPLFVPGGVALQVSTPEFTATTRG